MPARSVKNRRKSRKQKGGTALTEEQFNILDDIGFTDDQKNAFNRIVEEPFNENVTNMLVNAARNDIRRINPQTGQPFTPQELINNMRNLVRNVASGKKKGKSINTRKKRKQRK
jgi:hypothetical protein